MVRAEAQDGVSTLAGLPAEEPPVKPYCWTLDLRSQLASLPSVPLGFLNQLAGYAVGLGPILRVDEVVQLRVSGWSVVLDCLKCVRCKPSEDAVRVLEFAVLAVREWQEVELQGLLRRHLPRQRNVAPTTSIGEIAESVPQFLPRINSWVSLRCFYDPRDT
jgi:hypothetical protein